MNENAAAGRGDVYVAWQVLGIIVIILLYVAMHVLTALVTRNNPPVACQLLGGTWNIWDGWRCG